MRTLYIAGLIGSAAFIATPALAQQGHGNSGGHGQPTAQPTQPTSPTTSTTTMPSGSTRDTTTAPGDNGNRRVNSQGPENASPTGIENANERSVLADGAVAADTLEGLATGQTVNSSSGTSLGTISQIVTGKDGSIRTVIVTTSTGQTIRLPANSLTISGDVVTTTSTTP